MRCSMNQAVLGVRSYLRSISRAETPFFDAHISNTTNSQVRTGTFEPWKIVPVRTENCLRQLAHFQTRRSDFEPVRVERLEPSLGVRKYGRRSDSPQCGQTVLPSQRRSSSSA